MAAAATPAMRHAGRISNQRSRMPADSAAALRAVAAAADPPASEVASTAGAVRSSAASVSATRASGEVRLQTRAFDSVERVLVVRRDHIGRRTRPGARVRLVVARSTRSAKRQLDRSREPVI